MGQQVVYHQLGLVPLANGHLHGGAVLQGHHAVELQGDGDPLVLADAAVVVGLEVGHLALLIEGAGLQVQPGAVDMGGGDLDALVQLFLPHHGQQQHLAPVVLVDLVPGLQRHAPHVGLEALGLRQPDALGDALPLGLPGVQKGLVALAVRVHGLPVAGGQPVIAVLLLPQYLFLPSLRVHVPCSSIQK